jgi:polyisoprenyl-teichoic acid--peptidoglycan teichoic acid transferase
MSRKEVVITKKKRSGMSKVLISIVLVVLVLVIGGGTFAFTRLGRMNRQEIPRSDDELGIIQISDTESIYDKNKKNSDIINIALFGLDTRVNDFNQRSDSIMVVSIDKKSQEIKVTSLMRDMKVLIPGRNEDKLNHAYAYGGAALAIKTINSNFDLNIRDFVTVNFFGLEKLIDKVGGVKINVSESEANYVSINSSGNQVLSGKQAVEYSRIRKIGGDYQRTDRQREVLDQLFKKIKAGGALKLPGLIDTMLPYVETSLSNGDILGLGQEVIKYDTDGIKELRMPINDTFKSENTFLVFDLAANKQNLHEFIYGNNQ